MAFRSVLQMPNIESFPEREVLDIMHFFARIDNQYGEIDELRNRAQAEIWVHGLDASQQRLATYRRIFKFTYYAIDLRIVRRRWQISSEQQVSEVVVGSSWIDYPFLLRRVVNLVVNVHPSVDARERVAVEAIEGQVNSMPNLERLTVRVCPDPSKGFANDMSMFLAYSLRDLAKRRHLEVEVPCVV